MPFGRNKETLKDTYMPFGGNRETFKKLVLQGQREKTG